MIALLCPTKGRPGQFKRMTDSAGSQGVASRTVYAALSEKDFPSYHQTWNVTITPDEMPTVHKWNILATEGMKDKSNKLFMLCADDIIFSTSGWDKALMEHYNALDNKIHVYALQDSRDHEGTPHPIVTREYIDAMGYFLPPIFLHWFVDTWTVEIAKANKCFTHMKDYILTHDKPSDIGKPDETHLGIRRMGWHERDRHVNDTCQHFLELEKRRLAEAMK